MSAPPFPLRSDLKTISIAQRLEWDVFLTEVQKFKHEILRETQVSATQKREILTRNLPRFLWRAIAYEGQARKIDMIFDATDLLQGRQLICSIRCDPELEAQLAHEFKTVDSDKCFELTKNILDHFISEQHAS